MRIDEISDYSAGCLQCRLAGEEKKMGKTGWELRILRMEDLSDDALGAFDRFQETQRIRFQEGEGYVVKESHFTDEWDEERREEVVRSLRACLTNGGSVLGAMKDGQLLGFASVEPEPFGRHGDYLQLANLHVSREARHHGVGKQLFRMACAEGRKMGARKLYISAHSSVETQRFYDAVGCVYAKEVNAALLEKEPFDIQLEYDLGKGNGGREG